MPALMVVGGQFGDEGKGKIVSYLALNDNPTAAVRGGVGPNAGHTVIHDGEMFKFRMLPSAVINKDVKLMIGSGVLVDPNVLLEEVRKFKVSSRVMVDNMCGIIEEKHIERDTQGYLKDKIGTTGTGTGPAQADRIMRTATVARELPSLSNLVGDVSSKINEIIDCGELVLVEGTQGTFLSLYHGTYPYVTSKDVTASSICADVGIGPKRIDEIIVVYKAYTTRVGGGPLEDELTTEEIERRGWKEVGTVTGRVRRAAPLKPQLAKKAAVLNSATQIALTKLDILFPECKGGREISKLSSEAKGFVRKLEECTGIPITLIGTGQDDRDIIDRRV